MKINGELQNLLFSYFHQEHDIMLLDSDFREIENMINSGGYRGNIGGMSEQLVCDCEKCKPFPNHTAGFRKHKTCIKDKTN